MGGRQGKANGVREVPGSVGAAAPAAAASEVETRRAAWAQYDERAKAAEDARGQLFKSLKGLSKPELLGILNRDRRVNGMSTKDSVTDLKYAITSAAHADPREPRFPRP